MINTIYPFFLFRLILVNYFVSMVRCGGTAYFSPMMSAHDALGRGSIEVTGVLQFVDLHPGFQIEVELFRMVSRRREFDHCSTHSNYVFQT